VPKLTIKPTGNDVQVYVWFNNEWTELDDWNIVGSSWTHIKYHGRAVVEKFIADIKKKAEEAGFVFVDSPELQTFLDEMEKP
jgi:hypothetical protein